MTPTFVDLFCGVGGLSLGFVQAGFRQLGGFDHHEESVRFYERNLRVLQPTARAFASDLRVTGADVIRELVGVAPDVIIGGPPCQGFSVMGKRDPNDPRSTLTTRFAELVVGLSPRVFVMENVPGLRGMPAVVRALETRLKSAGYSLSWNVIDATSVGVPQTRRRVVFTGVRVGAALVLNPTKRNRTPTVADAFAGLPLPTKKQRADDPATQRYPPTRRWSEYAAELRSPAGTVSGCAKTEHTESTIKRFERLGPGDADPDTCCRRLDGAGQAFALRAGTREGTACRPIHPTQTRVITVREAARLHSYPDWFEFSPIISQAHVQIGNSVPPLMAAWIGQRVAQYLGNAGSRRRQEAVVA